MALHTLRGSGVGTVPQPQGAAQQAVQRAALRRLGQGEAFAPRFQMDALDSEFPDSMHRKMKYARDYLRILNETGGLTDAKWGVLEEIAESTPGFADRLNLATPSQARAAAVSEGTRVAQGRPAQRMAGQAVRQHASPRSGVYAVPSGMVSANGRSYEVYGNQYRERNFEEIPRRGSPAGVEEGMRRITGSIGQRVLSSDGTGRYLVPEDIQSVQSWDLFSGRARNQGREISPLVEDVVSRSLSAIQGKYVNPQVISRGIGRLTSEQGRLIADYARKGLHVGDREAAAQRNALRAYWDLATEKAKADKGEDWLYMLGNFVNPMLDENSTAQVPALFRGDVVPLEQVGMTSLGGGSMSLGNRFAGSNIGSFSAEPFQAYRYSMMTSDGRLDWARRQSPSGQAVRRIIEVIPNEHEIVPVINSDLRQEGKSELLYPLSVSGKKLSSEHQIFNAQDPSVPLIWQRYV